MKKTPIILVVVGFLIFSCNNLKKKGANSDQNSFSLKKIEQLQWIIGTWQSVSTKRQLYEVWTKSNDTLYSASSFMVANSDTVFLEKITLQLRGGDLFYIPAVSNQNDGQPVPFQLISDRNGEFVFENKTHDFPQRIIYKNPHPDSLHARIEGNKEGEFRKVEFFMSREKK